MSDTNENVPARRKALLSILALAAGAYVAPAMTTLSVAEAKGSSSSGGGDSDSSSSSSSSPSSSKDDAADDSSSSSSCSGPDDDDDGCAGDSTN
jgi:hypothetical protein